MLRVYLDTNVWCRPFDEQIQKRIIEETDAFFKTLRKVDRGEATIIGSGILIEEIEAIEEGKKKELVQELMQMAIFEWVDGVPDLYKDIKQTGLKLPDSIHLACAIENAEYFISVDDDILKKGKEIERLYKIKVVNPIDFLKIEGE
ncbi:MAG: PIN domain-containing protein [Candidatus Hydrothermarchaeaceae archaeon]